MMFTLTRRTVAATLTAATIAIGAPVAIAPAASASPASECAEMYPDNSTARRLCESRLELRDQRQQRATEPRKPAVTRVVPTGESPLDREQRLQERRDERNRNRVLTTTGVLAVIAVIGAGAWAWTRRRQQTPVHTAHAPSQPAAQVYPEQWTPQPAYAPAPAYAQPAEPMPDYSAYYPADDTVFAGTPAAEPTPVPAQTTVTDLFGGADHGSANGDDDDDFGDLLR
ncbi:hypothetical protein I3U40_18200 [Mycobacteroides abscessus subsp. abscessus]|uniref:hypothetical protein n=1 Tax=Mycobacteroides abscessus TaxID=36809 RepID=UPI0009D53B01|nr:hypothetical protein [Mycobacteroides abscessus]QSM92989.1 hypothetical protein I3U31_18190 [Mycobacteroides abscessus subsp. abscessus]QSM98027.1 hypothetical protein I3U40_18200 [Mycobacteroides abscessus subsp. abscessus]SLI40950.1 Uncharacterised protein [Mycobacteroides abscessus subsp. abscessus]